MVTSSNLDSTYNIIPTVPQIPTTAAQCVDYLFFIVYISLAIIIIIKPYLCECMTAGEND